MTLGTSKYLTLRTSMKVQCLRENNPISVGNGVFRLPRICTTTSEPATANVPVVPPLPVAEPDLELNTVLMESTFLIEGPATQGGAPGTSIGTVFIVGRPVPSIPLPNAVAVLVTAAHVLEDIQGDFAVLHLRKKVDEKANQWVEMPYRVQIRINGQPVWRKNPVADVAAMYINVPADAPIKPITTLMFADDKMMEECGVNPGDEVRSLGYPLGLKANAAGFPDLRSGKIASYPLTPTERVKTFLVDFRVFKGNSGGPVYFVEKNRPLMTGLGRYETFHFIIGFVTEESLFTERAIGPYSQEIHQTQLGLAVVVYASLIKQTIEMLPIPPQ
jgi:hypothetical protein